MKYVFVDSAPLEGLVYQSRCDMLYVFCSTPAAVGSFRGSWEQGRGGGGYACRAWPQSYDHGPSRPHDAGTEHVGFLTDQADNAVLDIIHGRRRMI